MKNIRDHFDYTISFWVEFPEYTAMVGFEELFQTDRSRNKKTSSTIAWSIHLAFNPNSKFYNIPDKLSIIARDILKDETFDWTNSAIELAIDIYKESVLTQAERSLESWNQTLAMRDKGLKEWYKEEFDKANEDRDMSTIEKLDKQMANTARFFADFKKISAELREEHEGKKTKIKSESDGDDF